jgi:hypothetical protein
MIKVGGFAVAAVLALVHTAAAAECEIPRNMTKEQKEPCVRGANLMRDQPTLTMEQLGNGPDFNGGDPAFEFLYFTAEDNPTCYFRPHYAFKAVKGKSLKFQCWQLAADRHLLDEKGQPVAITDIKVVLEENSGGENRAHLYAKTDTTNQNEIDADRFKVKYLKPPHPEHDRRYNEVFTELAAGRILWALGFPADHVYPVASVNCVGCTASPFESNLEQNTAALTAAPSVFRMVTVERDIPWSEIDPENDETWSWQDVARYYADGTWTQQQKIEYDAYRLALGLFNYHNAIDVQNRVACAEFKEGASNPRICTKPYIFVQDLGSTFGKPKGFIFGTNPRGDFAAWQSQTVFKNASSCELRAHLDGDRKVLKAALDIVIDRAKSLDRTRVREIFKVARFDLMDQKQLKKIRETESDEAKVREIALDQWTDLFMQRIAELSTAQNCKS